MVNQLPPGKQKKSYWTWPLRVDLTIKVAIFHSCVSLPEGRRIQTTLKQGILGELPHLTNIDSVSWPNEHN